MLSKGNQILHYDSVEVPAMYFITYKLISIDVLKYSGIKKR